MTHPEPVAQPSQTQQAPGRFFEDCSKSFGRARVFTGRDAAATTRSRRRRIESEFLRSTVLVQLLRACSADCLGLLNVAVGGIGGSRRFASHKSVWSRWLESEFYLGTVDV